MSIKVIQSHLLPEGGKLIVTLSTGEEAALFRIKGKIYAVDNTCPHEGGPIGDGEVDGCVVTCPWHEWQFSLESGECLNMPGSDLKRFKVWEKSGEIYLETEE